MKRYTLKVYLTGKGREVYKMIEITEKNTLDQLCAIILESFGFIDGHLYEFCIDNRGCTATSLTGLTRRTVSR